MSNPEIGLEDDDIAALLDELEAEVASATPAAPAKAAKPAKPANPVKVAEPEPIASLEGDDLIELEPVVEDRAAKPVKAAKTTKPEKVPNETTVAAMEEARDIAVAKVPSKAEQLAVEDDAIGGGEDKPATAKASLNFYVDAEKFQKETKFTEATLDDAMMQQAGLRAYYGTMAANAEAQHSRLKVRFEVLEAKLYDEHRKNLESSGAKVTEKAVESAVKLDPRWATAKNAVIEAETIASVNRAMVFSLADRRDMLIQLGADRREEFKGTMRINVQNEQAEALAARAKNAYKGSTGVQ